MKLSLFNYWKQKELELNKSITVAEVARGTGLSRTTLTKLLTEEGSEFNSRTVDALCRFFEVPAGPVPFLVYTPED